MYNLSNMKYYINNSLFNFNFFKKINKILIYIYLIFKIFFSKLIESNLKFIFLRMYLNFYKEINLNSEYFTLCKLSLNFKQ